MGEDDLRPPTIFIQARQRHSLIPVLNDDILLLIFSQIGLKELLRVRQVCKRWRSLTFHRTVLSRHYTSAHPGLHRAHGPAQWHTTDELNLFLTQSDKLVSNLNSDRPVTRNVRTLKLPDAFDSSNVHHPPRVCGPLLVVLHERHSLVCYDLDDFDRGIIWSYNLNGNNQYGCFWGISRCVCEPGGEVPSWRVYLCLVGHREIKTVRLEIRNTDAGVIEVTNGTVSEIPWTWNVANLDFKQDWMIVSSSNGSGAACLLDSLSNRRIYELKRHKSTATFTIFASPHYAIVVHRLPGNDRSMIRVYNVPSREDEPNPPGPDTELVRIKLDSTHAIKILKGIYDILFIGSYTEPTHDSESSASPSVIKTTLQFVTKVRRFDNNRGTFVALMDLTLLPSSSSCEISWTCYTPHPPSTCIIGEYRTWAFETVTQEVQQEEGGGRTLRLLQFTITLNEDGKKYGFGKAGLVQSPLGEQRSGAELPKWFFDDIRGRVYHFEWVRPNWVVHVFRYV